MSFVCNLVTSHLLSVTDLVMSQPNDSSDASDKDADRQRRPSALASFSGLFSATEEALQGLNNASDLAPSKSSPSSYVTTS